MKKQKKVFGVLIIVLLLIIMGKSVYAISKQNSKDDVEYTEDYKNYLSLSEEERKKVIKPYPYEIKLEKPKTKNIYKLASYLGANSGDGAYSLKSDIPENVRMKNQKYTNICWAYASLESLETTLALQNKINGIQAKVYDFSEKHLDYSSVRSLNDGTNIFGYNRTVNTAIDWTVAKSYFINGMGAVNESEVPTNPDTYVNSNNQISLSDIQNKNIQTTVYDTVEFSSNGSTDATVINQIKTKIKKHVVNHGAVFAAIHGTKLRSKHCNFKTGAIYCNNTTTCCPYDTDGCKMNHAVAIIGWNDNYDRDNFNTKPTNNGAWIIKNSWGDKQVYDTVDATKTEIYNNETSAYWAEKGVTEASQISIEQMKEYLLSNYYWDISIEDNKVYVKIAEQDGIMYVSYEDINIYKLLAGIEKATDKKEFENIYQYDETSPLVNKQSHAQKFYLANVFSKKTQETEYIKRSWNRCSRKIYL